MIEFEGANYLRQRLVLSTLSGKPVKIIRIRDGEESPGLNEYEANLLKLLDKLTNGTMIKINVTGTTLIYKPGMLVGGEIDHECNSKRSIGYVLEVLFCLAPFCKKKVKATLRGITNDTVDPSVDFYRLTSLPLMKLFGIADELELKVLKRAFAPDSSGEVYFHCPNPKKLRPLQNIDQGKIKRIRGVAFASCVSPQIPNRIIESACKLLKSFIPDVYITSDHMKGASAGKAPGFGIVLTAETTTGIILASEHCSNPKGEGERIDPESVGNAAACKLLNEVYKGGIVDSTNQPLAALLMVLCDPDVSKILCGPLTSYTAEFLRNLNHFFQVMFKLEHKINQSEEKGGKTGCSKVLMTCTGVGYSNINKMMR